MMNSEGFCQLTLCFIMIDSLVYYPLDVVHWLTLLINLLLTFYCLCDILVLMLVFLLANFEVGGASNGKDANCRYP